MWNHRLSILEGVVAVAVSGWPVLAVAVPLADITNLFWHISLPHMATVHLVTPCASVLPQVMTYSPQVILNSFDLQMQKPRPREVKQPG